MYEIRWLQAWLMCSLPSQLRAALGIWAAAILHRGSKCDLNSWNSLASSGCSAHQGCLPPAARTDSCLSLSPVGAGRTRALGLLSRLLPTCVLSVPAHMSPVWAVLWLKGMMEWGSSDQACYSLATSVFSHCVQSTASDLVWQTWQEHPFSFVYFWRDSVPDLISY